MKQLSYFVALATLLMSASCQKEDTPTESSVKDPVFTATIANDDTKTSLDLSTKKVSWTLEDEITVNDGSVSVKYKVSSIDGNGVATFTKKSGETDNLGSGPYTATYGEAPSASQTYSTEVAELPMEAPSTSGTSLTFAVNCGLLKVTLNQTGISISSIAVSDGTNTYTLTCSPAVSIETGATFYIAVPAGTYTSFKFTDSRNYVSWRSPLSISVEANHIKPVSSNFGPEYKENEILYGYGSKINGTWWASVNCGYDANHTLGLLYQWGRKVGGGYDSTEGMQTATAATATTYTDGYNKNPDDDKFYYRNTTQGDWYSKKETTYTPLTAWPMKSDDDGYVDGKIANPCPSGWRVPTYDELNALIGNKGLYDKSNKISSGWDDDNKGYWFNGTLAPCNGEGLFFPAAGYRYYSTGVADLRNSEGDYWSSTVNGSIRASFLHLIPTDMYMNSNCRAFGFSVRCVKE